MRGRGAILLCIVTACHSADDLPMPPLGDVASAVLVAIEGTDEIAIAVDRPTDGPIVLPEILQTDDLELYALGFDCPLVSTGLQPGSTPLSASPQSAPLVEPVAAFRMAVPRGGSADWASADGEPIADIRARLGPGIGACTQAASFANPKEIDLPVEAVDYFAFSYVPEPGRAILGSIAGSIYSVTTAGQQSRLDLSLAGSLMDAHAIADDTYAIDRSGRIYRGSFDTAFEVVAMLTSTVQADLGDLTGPPADRTDAPLELFAVDSDGRFMHFDGTEQRVVFTSSATGGLFIPKVQWMAPGEAVTYGLHGRDELTWYRQGNLETERIVGASRLTSIARHPTHGLLVGTSNGGLWAKLEGRWTSITESRGDRFTIVPLGDGVWTATTRGFLPPKSQTGFWSPSTPFCDIDDFGEGLVIDLVEVEPNTLFIVTQRNYRASFFVTRVDLERDFAVCGPE